MARKATAQDVADLAGVSRSAVSLVLNGRARGHISSAKQQAVVAAAEQLHYTPNAVALSLRSQRSRTLGVLSWPARGSFAQVLLHRALTTAQDQHYLLLMVDTAGDADQERRQLETLRDRQVDGYLIIAPGLQEYTPPDLLLSAPTVLVNCLDVDGVLSSVAPDEVEAGRRAAEVLLERGHRRVGLVVGDPDQLQTRLRVLGVEQAFRTAGLPGPVAVPSQGRVDEGQRAADALLRGDDRPTAILCTHERLAVGAALAAASLGLEIPAMLSLVSLEDGEGLAESLVPAVTTVQRPDAAMAEQAVELLVEWLGTTQPQEQRNLVFSCPVQQRASVSVPAR